MTRTRVLIVDDSLTVRMDLSEAFEAAGFDSVPCSTVAEARDALARESIPIVVLDVILPDGDGITFLQELRENEATADIRVLLLSTESEVQHRIRGIATGADDYVGKPYDTHYVVAKARELVADRNRSERIRALIIDDSPTYLGELEQALVAAGYDVSSAATGEEGLRVAADVRPDAIIVDGVLPGMDGAAVIRHIRLDAALRRTPCLVLTGSEEEVAEVRALDSGADTFARKDEDLAVVLARLATIIRSSRVEVPHTPASLLGPKKVLAVDDSDTYLHSVADVLRTDGYDVILAHSGEEAMELLAIQQVDCILLDLLMPGLGGTETCRFIKRDPALRDTPLIMLTAIEDRNAMIEGLSAGADDYISKSADMEVLKARVRAQIRRRQFEDENRLIRDRLMRVELEAAEARAARAIAEARAELVEELEQKNQELEAFSYSVSHDLRAPLRAIDGFSAAVLEDYGGVLDERAHGYLGRVRAAAQRMSELIDDLLELSRVARSAMHREVVNLTVMARQVATGLERNDPQRQVRFAIEEGLFADADPRLIRVVLENLLGNAWKFTSRIADPLIELTADRTDDQETFHVRDNGAGFDMAHAEKLFAPFQRLHSDQQFPGTGIGLATVQRIIRRHGGRVWAEGRVDGGACISWTLPGSVDS